MEWDEDLKKGISAFLDFLMLYTEPDVDGVTKFSKLYDGYKHFCEERDVAPITPKRAGSLLKKLGYMPILSLRGGKIHRAYRGLVLRGPKE